MKLRLSNPFILIIIAAFCGSLVPIVAKFVLGSIDPITLNFLRFLFATLFLIPFIHPKEFTKKNVNDFILVGVLGAINPFLFIIALQYTQASIAPLMYASVPALTALYSYVFLKAKLSPKQLLGIAVGFLGVIVLTLLPLIENDMGNLALMGNILFFIAAVTFTIYGIMSKKLQDTHTTSPLTLTFIFCLASLVISAPFVLTNIPQLYKLTIQHIGAGMFLGIIGTGVFYLAYQFALKKGSEVTASLFVYLQPVITVIMAILLLGEKVTLPLIVGGVIALVGARLASKK